MVLPPQVDWENLAVVVSSNRPSAIRTKILDDYRRRDWAAFLQRQRDAFAPSDRLNDEGWLADSIRWAVKARLRSSAEQ